MIDIGLAGALVGGILSLLSPCSVMLLPAFFATAFADPRTLITRAGLFLAGLLTSLVPLGLFAGAVGGFFLQNRETLILVASILLILLGLAQLSGLQFPGFSRGGAASGDATSGAAMYVLGAVYAVAGVCSGPILGSVLTVAASGGSPLYGGLLLAVYALGMAVPLLVLSLLWKPLGPRLRNWLRPRELVIGRWRNSWVMIVAGLVSIAFGVLLLVTNGTATLGGFLTPRDQAAIEYDALTSSAGVSDLVLVLGIAVVALISVLVASRMRSRAESANEPATETADTTVDD